MIPILFVCGAIVVAIVAVIIHGRNKDLEHKERIAAMEKGIQLPEPKIVVKPVYSARRAWALVFLGIGLGLTIGLWGVHGAQGGVWGFLPMFIGAGLLAAAILDKREYEERQQRGE